jgi:hypothetical protein
MYNKHREEIREKLQKAIRARARALRALFFFFKNDQTPHVLNPEECHIRPVSGFSRNSAKASFLRLETFADSF